MAKVAFCTKMRHDTRQAAEEQRRYLYRRDKVGRQGAARFGRMAVYLCQTCGCYHVGHVDKSHTDKKRGFGRKRKSGDSSALLTRRGQG